MLDNINNAIDFLVLDNLFIVLLVVLALLVLLLMIGVVVASLKEYKKATLEEVYGSVGFYFSLIACMVVGYFSADIENKYLRFVVFFLAATLWKPISIIGPKLHRKVKIYIENRNLH